VAMPLRMKIRDRFSTMRTGERPPTVHLADPVIIIDRSDGSRTPTTTSEAGTDLTDEGFNALGGPSWDVQLISHAHSQTMHVLLEVGDDGLALRQPGPPGVGLNVGEGRSQVLLRGFSYDDIAGWTKTDSTFTFVYATPQSSSNRCSMRTPDAEPIMRACVEGATRRVESLVDEEQFAEEQMSVDAAIEAAARMREGDMRGIELEYACEPSSAGPSSCQGAASDDVPLPPRAASSELLSV